MNASQRVGARLKYLRIKNNFLQEEVAERAEVSMRTISNVENGNFNARLDVVDKIANVYGAEVSILMKIDTID